MTKTVMVGGLPLGGGNPVPVQSMTNTDTRDAEATLRQIRALHDAGCDIVRVSVYDDACTNGRLFVPSDKRPAASDTPFPKTMHGAAKAHPAAMAPDEGTGLP